MTGSNRRTSAFSSATESRYQVRAKLWRWPLGKASWFFITLPAGISREIRLVDAGPRRTGFGALRVTATIGETCWRTSIFPSAQLKSYLLPVKAGVRKACGLVENRSVSVEIRVSRAG
jgi:hypothetical protein